jgi:hypothetical protein
MKNFCIVCAAVVVAASLVSSASAGDRVAPVSKSVLSSMGLGGMQQMTDSEGLAVRGKGTSAQAWGSGFSHVGLSYNNSHYNASAAFNHTGSSAHGQNTTSVANTLNIGSFSLSFVVNTAGSSSAGAGR